MSRLKTNLGFYIYIFSSAFTNHYVSFNICTSISPSAVVAISKEIRITIINRCSRRVAPVYIIDDGMAVIKYNRLSICNMNNPYYKTINCVMVSSSNTIVGKVLIIIHVCVERINIILTHYGSGYIVSLNRSLRPIYHLITSNDAILIV